MVKIEGKVIAVGDAEPEEMEEGTPRVLIRMPDKRVVMVIGLSRDECRAMAPSFMCDVQLTMSGVKTS